jgi:hypothetical protein
LAGQKEEQIFGSLSDGLNPTPQLKKKYSSHSTSDIGAVAV